MTRVLLITSSSDATSDVVVSGARAGVFRLNVDLLPQYRLVWDKSGCLISDPTGRSIATPEVGAYYWRKPLMELPGLPGSQQEHDRALRREIALSIADSCKAAGVWGLIDHRHALGISKLLMLEVAHRHMPVPDWRVVSGDGPISCGPGWITKSLVTVPVTEGKYMMTHRVPPDATLSGEHVWFLQAEVDATHDVTVVWCCGRQYAYQLDRQQLGGGVDWRLDERVMSKPGLWERIELPPRATAALDSIMMGLGLHFGRIDLLRDRADTYWFLEVNPNGQYAWLDLDGTDGMVQWIIDCASHRPPFWAGASG